MSLNSEGIYVISDQFVLTVTVAEADRSLCRDCRALLFCLLPPGRIGGWEDRAIEVARWGHPAGSQIPLAAASRELLAILFQSEPPGLPEQAAAG